MGEKIHSWSNFDIYANLNQIPPWQVVEVDAANKSVLISLIQLLAVYNWCRDERWCSKKRKGKTFILIVSGLLNKFRGVKIGSK